MPHPNVIIFHADQMRADALGAGATPRLDALAREGITCTRHIAANPICMPSRASLLCGLYPTGHGVWTNGVALPRREYARADDRYSDWGRVTVTPEPPTMPDLFAAAGYDTAAIGKLHLHPTLAPAELDLPESEAWWARGGGHDWHGPYFGFRHVELTCGHGESPCRRGHYADWLARERPDALRALEDAQPERPVAARQDLYLSAVPSDAHHSAWIGERAIDWIEHGRDRDKPFLLFCGFPDPHHPFTPPADAFAPFADMPVAPVRDARGLAVAGHPCHAQRPFDTSGFSAEDIAWVRRTTACMVGLIDRAVGGVLDAVARLGLASDTIVVFTADHGDYLCDHGLLTKSHFANHALLNVPCVLRVPGMGACTLNDATSNVDILPTLARLCDVPTTPQIARHGRDLFDDGPRTACAMASTGAPATVNLTCYDARYRYTVYPVGGYEELRDHADDPEETRNLAADPAHADARARLRAVLAETMLRTWQPNVGGVSAW